MNSFTCKRNEDIERFFKKSSIRFEQADKARTYIISPELDNLIEDGVIKVLAYFTISVKVIKLPDTLSKSKRKKLDGINKNANEINCYLIGQLGKNDTHKDKIKGKEIIDYALETIYKCHEYLGMRIILVECENKSKLIKFYEDNGFERISIDEETGLIQLVRNIDNVVFNDGQRLYIK